MLRFENTVDFIEGLDRWLESCEELVEGSAKGLAARAFKFIVEGSAQWTGNLAASWSLSVGTPLAVSETPFKDIAPPMKAGPTIESALHMGSPEAVNYALVRARSDGALGLFRLGQSIWIATGVPYALNVENDQHPLTKQNFLREANTPVAMVQAVMQYSKVGGVGEISEATAWTLAREAL